MKKLHWLQWSYLFLLSAYVISLSMIAELTLWGILGACVLLIWFVIIKRGFEKGLNPSKQDQTEQHHDKTHLNSKPDRKDLDEEVIRALNIYRHEWMNDIQLLVGYAKLKKFDKLQEYVENMKNKAIQEGVLFKIGDPKLALFLYYCSTNCSNPALHLEVQPELRLDQMIVESELAGELMINTIKLFQHIADPSMDNKLLLKINQEAASSLVVLFDYTGKYDTNLLIHNYAEWKKKRPAFVQITEPIFEEGHASILFRMPIAKTANLGVTTCL